MNKISKNLEYLLRKTGLGKDAFGETIGLNRGNIGSYIDQKATPKIETLQKISETYRITIDDLINSDLANSGLKPQHVHKDEELSNFTVAQIIGNMYLRDHEFSKSPLLWMYIKMKILDGQITDEELIIEQLESVISNNLNQKGSD